IHPRLLSRLISAPQMNGRPTRTFGSRNKVEAPNKKPAKKPAAWLGFFRLRKKNASPAVEIADAPTSLKRVRSSMPVGAYRNTRVAQPGQKPRFDSSAAVASAKITQ